MLDSERSLQRRKTKNEVLATARFSASEEVRQIYGGSVLSQMVSPFVLAKPLPHLAFEPSWLTRNPYDCIMFLNPVISYREIVCSPSLSM